MVWRLCIRRGLCAAEPVLGVPGPVRCRPARDSSDRAAAVPDGRYFTSDSFTGLRSAAEIITASSTRCVW